MTRALMVIVSVLLVQSARAEQPELEVRTYVVQPGDSVWSIAAEFYGSGDKYPIIYQYNDFAAKPPFLLKPGQILRLPILGQGPEAQLDWLFKDVKAKPPRALDWLEARERMNLWRLYRVATGDESAAHIVFDDKTDLKLRENALLVIYGASSTAARTARRDKLEIMLEEGTIQGGLATLDEGVPGQKPLVIKTPSGQVDLLAKLAQVQAEMNGSIVSVYDGNAKVSAQGAAVDVQGGQGTVVKKGKRPEQARPLPEAPAWSEPGPALVAVITGQPGTWEASWKAAQRAATYRVELATDATFKQVLFDAEVGAGVTRMRLADLKPGKYAVRVSTRDADKLESRPGMARLVEVVTMQPQRALKTTPEGALEAVGFLQMAVAGASTTFAINGGPATPSSVPIRLVEPGRYTIALKSGDATTTVKVHVLAIKANIDIAGEPLARDATAQVSLKIADELGREALLPGLVLETSRGVELPLEETADGYRAVVPALEPPEGSEEGETNKGGVGRRPTRNDSRERLAVRARWLGGELAVREISYVAPPTFREQTREVLTLAPYRVSREGVGPMVTPRPESRLGLDTMLAHVDAGPGAFGLALDGELAFDRWGVGARMVAQDVRLAEGASAQARVQDLSLQLRRAFGDDIIVAPYLRVALPVGAGHDERTFGFEPGGLLRFDLGPLLIDARLAFLITPGRDDVARGDALLALTWHPNDLVALTLSGESAVPFGDGAVHNVVGMGVGVHLGSVRLGFAVGLGVGRPTRDELGAAFGRFVIDVGWPQ